MPRNGSGTYTLPQAAFVAGTTISSSAVNSDLSDIAAALTQSLSADGQTPLTGTIKLASGAPATPGITFASDPTTGLYLPVTGKLGLAADGALGVLVDGTATGVSDNNISNANGAVLCPVGSIMDWPGSSAPTGWLMLYGQVLSEATYPGLFAVVGSTYNTGGEGTGNFRLPDCRGRVGVGKDDMGGTPANRVTNAGSGVTGTTLGASGGAQNETVAQANLPNVNFTGTPPTIDTVNINDVTPWGSMTTGNFAIPLVSTGNTTLNLPGALGSSWSGNLSVASGGSGTPVTTLPPAIILNKIIFAGR